MLDIAICRDRFVKLIFILPPILSYRQFPPADWAHFAIQVKGYRDTSLGGRRRILGTASNTPAGPAYRRFQYVPLSFINLRIAYQAFYLVD